jgi:inosine-uridine nucleoside N-ribohydrolase
VPVTISIARTLARHHYGTRAATVASDVLSATNLARSGSYFWDPLAAVAVANPRLVGGSKRRIAVPASGDDAGRTLIADGGHAARVVTRVDRAGFR